MSLLYDDLLATTYRVIELVARPISPLATLY
jgi:hypothetical protein